MIDKEKVLHGLDNCGFHDGIPNICEVTECPYRDNKTYCVHELAHDAGMLISELLKAHEPAVDAVPVVHGRWINIPDKPEWDQKMCSVCGDYFCCQNNYCPNCGAKMDSEWRDENATD